MKELLNKISKSGLILDTKEGRLQIFSTKEKVDKELVSQIKLSEKELIAYLIKHKKSSIKNKKYEDIPKCLKNESYPISNAQLRLWFASQSEEKSKKYNISNIIEINSSLDVECFQKSIHAVIDRHEILRTVFKVDDKGEVRQFVLTPEELDFAIDYIDLRNEEDPESASNNYISVDSLKVFDLEYGPLLRACLLQLSDNKYVFFYNMHHIISDGQSMDILSRDVMMYYEAYASKTEPNIPVLPIQYKDYAVWQLDQLETTPYQEHKKYWLDKLTSEIPRIDLPSFKNRSNVKTNNGYSLGISLSKELTNKLDEFTRINEGSLFTVVLSVMNVLLYKYTSLRDITMGGPITDRVHPDLEDQIGFYVNTLVFRNQVNPNLSFSDFYKQVKETVLDDFAHQQYPFDKIVQDLELKHDPSRSPIFDISLTLHNSEDVVLNNIDDEIKDIGPVLLKNDVEFHATHFKDVVSLDVVFNNDIYDKSMISRLLRSFEYLLSNLLMSPERKLLSVEYLLPEERHELLERFNTSQVSFPENRTVLDVFYEQVSKFPESTAVSYENTSLTYKELDTRSSQLANCLLQGYGIEKGDFVGVHLDRSEQYIVCFLAILKSGAVYVPIDTGYPSDRKKYMIDDAAIKLLITDTNYMFDLPDFEGTLFALDVEFDAATCDSDIVRIADPDDLAYVIYTSGSTGKPKGVMIQHKGIYNTILAQIKAFDVTSNHQALQFASFSFDASISEIFLALLSGSTLYIASDEMRNDPILLGTYIEDNKIDVATLPPSYFQMMPKEYLKDFKVLITAGEAPDRQEVLSYLSYGSGYYNAYGPTETSICASIFKISKNNIPQSSNIPIGVPISNTSLYILDEHHCLKPKGAIGEIYIGGFGLAKGYLNQPDLTQEKFIDHPFKEGERLYRTGDIGCWLEDGTMEFKGRIDNQIKIRGYRVELGEIESLINENENIEQSIVVAKEDHSGSKQLLAYVVSHEEPDFVRLQKALEEKLPDYMVPKIYISLDNIPVTHNGKVDHKAIPNPEGELYQKEEYVAPSNNTEIKLVNIWEEILDSKEISVLDNFLQLGGHSLLAIKLCFAISKEFNVNFEISKAFKYPTIRLQAQYLDIIKSGSDLEVLDSEEVVFL